MYEGRELLHILIHKCSHTPASRGKLPQRLRNIVVDKQRQISIINQATELARVLGSLQPRAYLSNSTLPTSTCCWEWAPAGWAECACDDGWTDGGHQQQRACYARPNVAETISVSYIYIHLAYQ
jgi:hypothetical protein